MPTGLLTQTCDIQRRVVAASTSTSRATETFTTIATSVACRVAWRSSKQGEMRNEAAKADFIIFLPFGTDIKNGDRCVVGDDTYEVKPVNPDAGARGHHVEAHAYKVQTSGTAT